MKNEILEKMSKGYKNVIIEGQVSSGKTTNVLFPIIEEIIDKKESFLVLDSKEEYLNTYYKDIKEKNYNTIIINLRDPSISEGWNPLLYPYELYESGNTDKAQELIETIGKSIFYDKKSVDPFWTDTAKDFFTGACLGLFEDGREEEINFNSINNIFNGVDKPFGAKDYTYKYFSNKGEDSKPYIFASSTICSPKETKGGILSVARQKLRLYISRDRLSKLLSKTTFDIDDIEEKPTAIILIGRDESNCYINQIVSLFIEQLYSILVDESPRNKFNLVLDNFDNIEQCDCIKDILSSCISRNIKTYIATRSINELYLKYGNSLGHLCDVIKINNNDIEFTINNITTNVDKNFKTVIIDRDNSIEYPKLANDEIKVFDIEKFVGKFQFEPINNPFESTGKDINKLIDDIDKKIEELEKEDARVETKAEEISIFEDFKV